MHGQYDCFSAWTNSLLKASTSIQIFFDPSPIGIELDELIERAAALPDPIRLYGSRLVIHIQTAPSAVDDLLTLIRAVAEEKRAAGFVPSEKQRQTNGPASIYKEVFVRKGRDF